MSLLILCIVLIILLSAGTPVAVAFGLSSLAYLLLEGIPSVVLLHTMITGLDSFALLAIPFFIFSGHLMNTAGITDKIFDFARSVVGWLPGGLGYVNVGASVVFSGMSGAAVADAAGLGLVEIKAMRKAGYDDDFCIGITAASSTIGPIIPPSLPLIVFGIMASTSIGKLFVAGIIPGILMAASLMLMIAFIARKKKYPIDQAFKITKVKSSFARAFLPLMTPVIIIGGIVTGLFTPTESAIAAAVYALVLGLVIYRTISFDGLMKATMETVETTSSILMIVAGATVFAWILAENQFAATFAGSLLSISTDPTLVLLMIMALVFFIGFFMETLAAIIVLVPVIIPVAAEVGIDPVHLGIVVILNLMIGLLTPPVGMILYVLSNVAKVPFGVCVRSTAIFLVPLILVLFLLVLFPPLTTWLPDLLYMD